MTCSISASDINEAGQVVGTPGPYPAAWIWDPTTDAMTLLPAHSVWSGPAINDQSQIAGVSGGHAALWNPTCCGIPG